MKIIDAHVHLDFNSKESKALAKSNKIDFSYEGLIKEMNSNKIERIVAISNSIEDNDRIVNFAKRNKRILAVRYVDIEKIELRILEKELEEKKFGGIKLLLGYRHFYPNDVRCEPIYQLAEKYNIPVIFHSGDVLILPSTKDAKIKYAHPIHIDDVATEHPEMKIIIAHSGNPWIMDAAAVALKNDNVFLDISGWILEPDVSGWPFPKVSGFYGKFLKDSLNFLVSFAGSHKILYGTDWPLVKMKHYINFVKSMKFKKHDFEKIMYKNAHQLFWKSK